MGLGEPGQDLDDLARSTCRGSTRSRARPSGWRGACPGARSRGPRREGAGAARAPRPARPRPPGPPGEARASRSASISRDPPGRPAGAQPEERLVEAARAEAPEVERHVDEPELPEPLGDGVRSPVLPEPRHLLPRDLEPRDLPVVPHAEVPEAERADGRLRPVDLAELLGGDRRPVGEAGRQARHGRLVPGRERERPRQLADLGLPESRRRSAARARRAAARRPSRAGGRRGRPRSRRRPGVRSPSARARGSSRAKSSSLQKKHRFGGLAA